MTANDAANNASAGPVRTAEALYRDVAKLAERDPKNKDLLEAQIHGATHLISLYARSKELTKAQSLFDEITEAISKNPDIPGFREMKAGVAVPLSLLRTALRDSSTRCAISIMR